MDYAENTKLAIVGVIAVAVISIFKLDPKEALEIGKLVTVGLIGYIARGGKEV